MNNDHLMQKLIGYLALGSTSLAGEDWQFAGQASRYPDGRESLEIAIGFTIPETVAAFIAMFGGTELFIGMGHGVQILPFSKVVEVNNDMQPEFFPKFVILGFDQMDDMLCLYNSKDGVHFGHLNHEAWGFPELWPNDGLTFCKFDDWLALFTETGHTIPAKKLRYEA